MPTSSPSLCILTQSAADVGPYYRQIFKGHDLFFVTFKQKNPEAIDFLPGSTWSDGRNRLWEHVKGKYDYYLFLDDDLEFLALPPVPTTLRQLLQTRVHTQQELRIRRLAARGAEALAHKPASPARVRKLLLDKINTYRPMVASTALPVQPLRVEMLDRYSLLRNRRVRPLTWFDAQFTLLSDVAAHLLLPYDTDFSGWWSSQIPIYLLGHLAFGKRMINILDVASQNAKHSIYRPGYDGFQDCLTMSKWLSTGLLNKDYDALDLPDGTFIDQAFAGGFTKQKVVPGSARHQTLEMALTTLGTSFDLHHPYVYQRHKELVDAIDAKTNRTAETIHG